MSSRLLLVDDEKVFLKSLQQGLSHLDDRFSTDIAFSYQQAVEKLKKRDYDLVITDIRMPGKSGIDLLLYLNETGFSGGIKVMSAHNTEETLRRINELGIMEVIAKPFDLEWFQKMLADFFEQTKPVDAQVTFESIDLLSVMQVINIDKKTSVLTVDIDEREGQVVFREGEVVHAEFAGLKGMEAVIRLVSENRGRISVKNVREKVDRTIDIPFVEFMMNTMKEIDEIRRSGGPADRKESVNPDNREETMAVKEVLKVLEDVNGYLGSGVFTPQGEMLEGSVDVSGVQFQQAGALIHDMLKNAKDLGKEAGFGDVSMIQLSTEMGIVFATCLHEGKLHFHTVLVIKNDGNVAMAKMKIAKVVEALKTVL